MKTIFGRTLLLVLLPGFFSGVAQAFENHVAASGAVFKRDRTYPALGRAYRDPHGLIWGDVLLEDGMAVRVYNTSAPSLCRKMGFRLPTEKEYKHLIADLTDANGKYHSWTVDKKEELLPALTTEWYWADGRNGYGNLFQGGFGSFYPHYNGNVVKFPVRCVTDAQSPLPAPVPRNPVPSTTDRRVSVTDSVFIRDARFPKLGEAYRDPQGLVWSENLDTGSSFPGYYVAESVCRSVNARLPTKDELLQLMSNLGYQSTNGYSAYTSDEKLEVLPGLLDDEGFWASTSEPNPQWSYLFIGASGYIAKENIRGNTQLEVRCVTR